MDSDWIRPEAPLPSARSCVEEFTSGLSVMSFDLSVTVTPLGTGSPIGGDVSSDRFGSGRVRGNSGFTGLTEVWTRL